MEIDKTKCPNCQTKWSGILGKPILSSWKNSEGRFWKPCELIHGEGNTASVYADLMFAFADQKFEEWSSVGDYREIVGDEDSWKEFLDSLETPDQAEGDDLTLVQAAWLRELDAKMKSTS